MSGASAIMMQWKAKGFNLHLLYFKQYHHVSGNKSLILQRASNSAREHCDPYELIPSTALIATHTRDLITKGGTWLTCCH